MEVIGNWCDRCAAGGFPRCGRADCCRYWELVLVGADVLLCEVPGLAHGYVAHDPGQVPVALLPAGLVGREREDACRCAVTRLVRQTLPANELARNLAEVLAGRRGRRRSVA